MNRIEALVIQEVQAALEAKDDTAEIRLPDFGGEG